MKRVIFMLTSALFATNMYAIQMEIPVVKRTTLTVPNNNSQNCWQEKRKVRVECKKQKKTNIGGILIGGLLGGVLGHQFGKGKGKKAATVAGGLLGSAVGSQTHKKCYAFKYVTRCDKTSSRNRQSSTLKAYVNCGYYKGKEYCNKTISPLKFITINVNR